MGIWIKYNSALIITNSALAMGMEASIYFTFWGLMRLKKGELEKGPFSKMNMLGLGKQMVKQRMDKANVVSLETLMEDFKELGGKIIACEMTMEIMGIKRRAQNGMDRRMGSCRVIYSGSQRCKHNFIHLINLKKDLKIK